MASNIVRIRSIQPELRDAGPAGFWVPVEVVGVSRWSQEHFDALLGPQDCALYRIRSVCRGLLYVGISRNPIARWRKHRIDKHWWGQANRIDLAIYPAEHAARVAERLAIETEHPRYNLHLAVC